MSLFATILFNRAVILPAGRLITHNPDHTKRALTNAQHENSSRNESIRMANVERIYNALAESRTPLGIAEIEIIAELSRTTCFNGLATLEDWPGGARIVRYRGTRHTFEVKK